ncbi:hypothetical protein [Streptomyces sp. NBC_01237]|uniref:hypothetical protein n=1 Tax=Streptomyces sp. NBC_01237 TaxID=2903790 RepID=UPI003FA3A4A0
MSPTQSHRSGVPGRASYSARPPAPYAPSFVISVAPVARSAGVQWVASTNWPSRGAADELDLLVAGLLVGVGVVVE